MNNQSYYQQQDNFKQTFDEGFEMCEGSFIQIRTISKYFENSRWFKNLTKKQRTTKFKGGLNAWLENKIKEDSQLKDHYKERAHGVRRVLVGYGPITNNDEESSQKTLIPMTAMQSQQTQNNRNTKQSIIQNSMNTLFPSQQIPAHEEEKQEESEQNSNCMSQIEKKTIRYLYVFIVFFVLFFCVCTCVYVFFVCLIHLFVLICVYTKTKATTTT